jgi:hypothetical protein
MIIGISDKCKRSAVAVLRRTKQNLGVRMKSQHSMDVQINLTKYNLHEDLCSLLNIKIHKEKLIELHSNAEINKKKKARLFRAVRGRWKLLCPSLMLVGKRIRTMCATGGHLVRALAPNHLSICIFCLSLPDVSSFTTPSQFSSQTTSCSPDSTRILWISFY